jgi:predicted NBD/HSP70 family sugar kinase
MHSILEFEAAQRGILEPRDPIVVSFPGPVADRRKILQAPTLVGGSTDIPDMAAELERESRRPIYLINDLAAAAWYYGANTQANRFQVVTVSSGIGSKVFDRCRNDRVLDDPVYGGEIGHIVVDDSPSAPVCDCGGKGHLGGIASGRGIEHLVRRKATEDYLGFSASFITSALGGRFDDLTNEHHVVKAALAGDPWTLAIIRDCTRPLARILLSTILAFGLDRVFVIGGFAQALGSTYLELLRALVVEMSRYALIADRLPKLIEMGAARQEVCLEGCAAFLRRANEKLRSD